MKTIYRITTILIAFAMILGVYSNARASFEPGSGMYQNQTANAAQATYYVSVAGNDANPGASSAPFKTIQKAVDLAAAGNTVIVLAGVYPEYVNINKAINLQAQGLVKENGFNVTGSGVTINGFDISNLNEATPGVGIYNQGSNNVYQNNYIHDTYWGGIETFATAANPGLSSNIQILNNRIYHVGQVGMDIRGANILVRGNDINYVMEYPAGRVYNPSWVDAHCWNFNGGPLTFTGNTCENILYSQPENRDPHIDAFQTFSNTDPVHPIAHDVVISNNVVNLPTENTALNLAAKFIQCSQGCGSNITVTNNVVIAPLVAIFNGGSNVVFRNNTFIAPAGMLDTYGVHLLSSTPGFALDHNIFYEEQNGVGAYNPSSAFSADYNCIYRDAVHAPYGSPAPHDVWNKDPQFVGGGDYRLKPASPCLTMGAYAVSNSPASTPTSVPQATITPTLPPVRPTVTATPLPPTAVPGASPTSPATIPPTVTQTIYDDTYRSFMFSSFWPLVSNSLAYKGKFKYTPKKSSSVNLAFTGRSFSILYVAGPGYGNMDIYVDNRLAGSLDQKSPNVRFQQRWDYQGQLSPGKHVLNLVFTGPANTEGTLDAVIVRQ